MEKNITLEDAVKRIKKLEKENAELKDCLLYTSPSPRDS